MRKRAAPVPTPPLPPSAWWTVPREWVGEPVFIVAGGPSVAGQDLSLLRGRRVIAINTSWESVPFADVLYFSDGRWWRANRSDLQEFRGRIVTVANVVTDRRDRVTLCKLRPTLPPGLSADPTRLVMRRSSLVAATNLAVLFGCDPIIWLGADGRPAADGRNHHHREHPWPQRDHVWAEQRLEIQTIVKPLRKLGVTLINASTDSAYADLWPVISLEDAIAYADRRLFHARSAMASS